jgi:hypothetical protein
MIYLAEDTEVRALTALAGVLAPDGRVLVGFDPVKGPRASRDYHLDRFRAHVEAAGLAVEHEFGSYGLAPAGGDYEVAVLRRAL